MSKLIAFACLLAVAAAKPGLLVSKSIAPVSYSAGVVAAPAHYGSYGYGSYAAPAYTAPAYTASAYAAPAYSTYAHSHPTSYVQPAYTGYNGYSGYSSPSYYGGYGSSYPSVQSYGNLGW